MSSQPCLMLKFDSSRLSVKYDRLYGVAASKVHPLFLFQNYLQRGTKCNHRNSVEVYVFRELNKRRQYSRGSRRISKFPDPKVIQPSGFTYNRIGRYLHITSHRTFFIVSPEQVVCQSDFETGKKKFLYNETYFQQTVRSITDLPHSLTRSSLSRSFYFFFLWTNRLRREVTQVKTFSQHRIRPSGKLNDTSTLEYKPQFLSPGSRTCNRGIEDNGYRNFFV